MLSLRDRWFGVGRPTDTNFALAAAPTTIFTGESLSMTSHCEHLHSPGTARADRSANITTQQHACFPIAQASNVTAEQAT